MKRPIVKLHTLKFAISLQYEIPYGIELVFSFCATLFFPN